MPTPEELPVKGGGGPWEGSYIVSGKPTITAATMYYHNDLDASAGPEYPIVDTIDAKVIKECAVPDSVVDAGKPGKVAITAVMRKLVVLANALVQQDRLWTPRPGPTA